MRFIAMASVSCASFEIEPNDMAPVAKRLTISLCGFDLFNRNRRGGFFDFEQAAQRAELTILAVEQVGIFLESFRASLLDCVL